MHFHDLYIGKSIKNRPDFVMISYPMIAEGFNPINRFYITLKELEYVFGHGILNCITNSIDSSFDIEVHDDIESFESSNIQVVVSSHKYFSYIDNKKNHILIRNYHISIKSENNVVRISIECTYANINNMKDEFKYRKCKELNFSDVYTFKEALDIVNFAFDNKIKLHSK